MGLITYNDIIAVTTAETLSFLLACSAYSSTLKMEAVRFSETSLNFFVARFQNILFFLVPAVRTTNLTQT
jgi:hypothetical protein